MNTKANLALAVLKSGRRSEQLSREQLALFAAKLDMAASHCRGT